MMRSAKTNEEIACSMINSVMPHVNGGTFNVKAEDWQMFGEVYEIDDDGPLNIALQVDPAQIDHQTVCLFQSMLMNQFNVQSCRIEMKTVANSTVTELRYREHKFWSDDYWVE